MVWVERVVRFVHTLAFALVIVAATGSVRFLEPQVCQQTCSDDDATGNCARGCSDCLCCGHVPSTMTATATVASPPPPERVTLWRAEQGLPSAELRAIEHVPKLSLA